MVELHPISIPAPNLKLFSSNKNSPNSNSSPEYPNFPSPSSLLSPYTPIMEHPPNPPPYFTFPNHYYYYHYHQVFFYPNFVPHPQFYPQPPAFVPGSHPQSDPAEEIPKAAPDGGRRWPENFYGNRNIVRCKTVKKAWRPKGSLPPAPPQRALPKNCTTVMIKNIPNDISRGKLIGMLENHCSEQNEFGEQKNHYRLSGFDFLYLPFDFKTKKNLGYAFVNFTSVEGAKRLFGCWDKKGWEGSRKIREITPAKLQGRDRCMKHFKVSEFHCHSEEYLPVVFSPARDGANMRTSKMSVIGTWFS